MFITQRSLVSMRLLTIAARNLASGIFKRRLFPPFGRRSG